MSELVGRGMRSARKPKGAGHLRRAEILDAAERIFVSDGYEGATIRKIADEVGVSSTALYMHFRDKSQILVEICQAAWASLIAVNTELLERDLDCVDRVRRMLEAYTDFARTNPNAYRLMVCSSSGMLAREHDRAVALVGRRTYDVFRAGVQRVADEGRLRIGDVDVAAQVFWAAGHGIISLRLMQPAFHWADPERLDAAALDAAFDGLIVR